MYQINLVYGYQEGECGIFHAFEAFDPNEKIDFEKVSKQMAEMLDTTADDVNYNCNMMYINIPAETVDRIIKDYIDKCGYLEEDRNLLGVTEDEPECLMKTVTI